MLVSFETYLLMMPLCCFVCWKSNSWWNLEHALWIQM